MVHIIDSRQFADREFLYRFFARADEMSSHLLNGRDLTNKHKGKRVASLFCEPSLLTKASFEDAARSFGTILFETENAQNFSSAALGEDIADSLWLVQNHYDLFIMRHPESHSARKAAAQLVKPLINAGDGENQHPTQALTDIYTTDKLVKRIEDLTVAFVGDAKRDRAIRSFAYLLSRLGGNKLVFVYPKGAGLEAEMQRDFDSNHVSVEYADSLDDLWREIDVLYISGLRKAPEKDGDEMTYLADFFGKIRISPEDADKMKTNSIILNPLPLPRTNSYGVPNTQEIKRHERTKYLMQANNHWPVRMALVNTLLSPVGSDELYSMIGEAPRTADYSRRRTF